MRRADGRKRFFAITKIEQYAKDKFQRPRSFDQPIDPCCGSITCGGQYDADSDTYTANVVAYGTLVATRT